jgi:hypothetical protein
MFLFDTEFEMEHILHKTHFFKGEFSAVPSISYENMHNSDEWKDTSEQ